MEQRVFAAVNAERARWGLHRLRWSEAVAHAAREHSCRMVELHYFSHDDPEEGSMPERLSHAGIHFTASSENIRRDRGHRDPVARAVRHWMMSLEHRAAILDRDYDHTGVGIVRAPDGTWYFTQIFIAALETPGGLTR
jgi:uncharacterized protein YkwD